MTSTKIACAVAVFALAYLLIAARRLRWLPIGRPAGALLGAVLMVATGVLTPAESYAAIDHDTIVLLFAMMVLTVYLERAGFFTRVAGALLAAGRTPMRLLLLLAVLAAVLSAFLVNDTVCLFLTPVVIATCRRGRLPAGPYLVALATSANIGSAATLVGNPQNMIVGSLSGMAFSSFTLRAGIASLAGLAVNVGLLWLYHRRGSLPHRIEVVEGPAAPVPPRGRGFVLVSVVTLGVVGCFFGGLHLGYATLGGVLVLVLATREDPREVLARVDWTLLVFFCGLFVTVAGLRQTGLVERAWEGLAPHLSLRSPSGLALFATSMAIGSNVVSNVPMVMLTGPHLHELGGGASGWVLLAFTTTVAGNLTLVGSVANIIVAERARDHYTLGFREYLRFGAVSTVAVLCVGVPLVALLG